MQLGRLVTRLEQEQNMELHFVDGLVETEQAQNMMGMFPGPYYTWCTMSSDNSTVDYESGIQAMNFVQEIIAEEGPFDGIMAFSQGAALSLALLLRHAIDHPLDPAYAICKFAIFFSCVKIDLSEWDVKLGIPSLHVLDRADNMLDIGELQQAMEPSSAKFIYHERGHSIPRDEKSVNMILAAIQDLQHLATVF
jgi:hypothetical protein